MTTIFATIIASFIALGSPLAPEPESSPAVEEHSTDQSQSEAPFADASELLDALSTHDKSNDSLIGKIRFTSIKALENDRKQRFGDLAIQRQADGNRHYAVSFKKLLIDDRQEIIAEHYIFDGHWLVERLPEEKQFNKRELVPTGETLDPMELMRDAPFWVSVGHDQERLLASYDAELLPSTQGLLENENFPELEYLAGMDHIKGAVQLKLTPKPDSGFEDDWEWVRIWITPETLNPALYIKAEWTGDLQIVELFAVKSNTDIPSSIFDTTSPDPRDGWNVQLSNWRGKE